MNRFLFLLLVVLPLISFSQEIDRRDFNRKKKDEKVENQKKLFFNIEYQNSKSFFHNAPIILDNCYSCYRENQSSINRIGFSINMDLASKKNVFYSFGIGVSQYGFKEDHYTSDGPLFKQKMKYTFVVLKPGIGINLIKYKRIQIIRKNYLALDVYTDSNIWLINRLNLSLESLVQINIKAIKNINLSISPFVRQSLSPYNKQKFDKHYWPYAIGIGTGIRI